MIPSKNEKDPLSPQVLQRARRVHNVFDDFNDAAETDIKHTHRLQSAIWSEIKRLEQDNAEKSCLSDYYDYG